MMYTILNGIAFNIILPIWAVLIKSSEIIQLLQDFVQ